MTTTNEGRARGWFDAPPLRPYQDITTEAMPALPAPAGQVTGTGRATVARTEETTTR